MSEETETVFIPEADYREQYWKALAYLDFYQDLGNDTMEAEDEVAEIALSFIRLFRAVFGNPQYTEWDKPPDQVH